MLRYNVTLSYGDYSKMYTIDKANIKATGRTDETN